MLAVFSNNYVVLQFIRSAVDMASKRGGKGTEKMWRNIRSSAKILDIDIEY